MIFLFPGIVYILTSADEQDLFFFLLLTLPYYIIDIYPLFPLLIRRVKKRFLSVANR